MQNLLREGDDCLERSLPQVVGQLLECPTFAPLHLLSLYTQCVEVASYKIKHANPTDVDCILDCVLYCILMV